MEDRIAWIKAWLRDRRLIEEHLKQEDEAEKAESTVLLSEEEKRIAKELKPFPDEEPVAFFVHQEKKRQEEVLTYQPLISVVIPVYNVSDSLLSECIDSVLVQSYQNFELILADDCSSMISVRLLLHSYRMHPKVRIFYRPENGRIARATNTALKKVRGEFIAFCDCDDVLHPDALLECVRALNRNPELDFIYTDEDKLTEDGVPFSPYIKPDWSPDMFLCQMYTGHLGVYRTSVVQKTGMLRPEFDGSQDYDFTLRFLENTVPEKICHIPKVLYHWRTRRESVAFNIAAKPYAVLAAQHAREDAFRRRNLPASVRFYPYASQFSILYEPPADALVSVVIPSKDHSNFLRTCLHSLDRYTDYRNFEVIVVDNGSGEEERRKIEKYLREFGDRRVNEAKEAGMGEKTVRDMVRYIYDPAPFNFSRMCNTGVKNARGSYILLLNDDIEIPKGQEQWMSLMLGHASMSWTGAVGCMLLYPGMKKIQHDGVISTVWGPAHVLQKYTYYTDRVYYFCRSLLEHNYAAVTAACLMISREKYLEAGGFDEKLDVNFNDVDFCWKLYEKGYFHVVRNDVRLCHHESVSRGDDTKDREKMKKLEAARELIYERHPAFKNGQDPYYTKGFTEGLVDFTYDPYPQDLRLEIPLPDRKAFKGSLPKHLCLKDCRPMSDWTRYNIEAVALVDSSLLMMGWLDDPLSQDPKRRGKVLLEGDRGTVFMIPFEWEDREKYFETLRLSRKDVGFHLRCSTRWMNLHEEEFRIGFLLEDEEGAHRRILRSRYYIREKEKIIRE